MPPQGPGLFFWHYCGGQSVQIWHYFWPRIEAPTFDFGNKVDCQAPSFQTQIIRLFVCKIDYIARFRESISLISSGAYLQAILNQNNLIILF